MSRVVPSHRVLSHRFPVVHLAGLLFALMVGVMTAGAQTPGLDEVPLVEPYFNGTFSLTPPGNGTAESWTLVNAYQHLTFHDPLVYTPLPGTNRIFVASRDGIIESFVNDPQTTTKDPCLDLQSITAVVWDGGFLGLGFHPQFGQGMGKDYMFVYHSARPEGDPYPGGSTNGFFGTYLRLARYDVDPVTYVADPSSEVQLFNIRLYNGSHRGGGLTFGADGLLYLSIGDQFRYDTAQNISNNFEGGIIRIDVDMDPVNSHPPRRFMGVDTGEPDEHSGNAYYIPNDNPFLDVNGGVFEEFWTVGHRAPHRLTYDALSDRFWSGEVGSSVREEINIIEGGNNYGWPFREGLTDGPYPEPPSYIGTLTDPVLDFTRADAWTIIGGYIYRGAANPLLYGKYICGDYSTNRIWALTYDDSTGTATREDLVYFNPGYLGTFGQDLDGEVYLCGLGPNRPIYKLERVVTNAPIPANLSEVGFFTDMTTLEVTPAAIPYEINVPFWSDNAIKSRWAIIPWDGSGLLPEELIAYREEGSWDFPEGTILVKHFDFPVDDTDPSVTRKLETRFLVNGFQGQVYGVTYRWDPSGQDAQLLVNGMDEDITINTATGTRTQTWHYPSRAECLSCHNSTVGYSLGFNARQLNRDTTYPSTGRTDNQLLTLSAVGLLDSLIVPADLASIPRLYDKSDETVPVQDRALSYLDANCSHCHQPGTGNRAGFDARYSTPLAEKNLVRGDLIDDLGITGAEVVSPQDPSRSMAHIRMSTRDGGIGMPPLASSIPDLQGAALMERWIDILDADYPVNIALGKAASQSSTLFPHPASLAVDGNTDGDMGHRSVTETAANQNAWWELDLGQIYDLSSVKIWNRTDCCEDRLREFHIFVSEAPFSSTDPAVLLTDPDVFELFQAGENGVSQSYELGVPGRYLRIQFDRAERLHMAEVQVFSSAWFGAPIESIAVGNDYLTAGGILDAALSNLVINRSDFYDNDTGAYQRLRVDEFSFHAAALGDPVTPFVAEMTQGGSFVVRAIGSTRLPMEMQLGPNSFAFGAIEAPVIEVPPGSKIVVGFLDAAPDGSGGGAASVVSFVESGATDLVYWTGGELGSSSGSVAEGLSPGLGEQTRPYLQRDYQYQVSFTRMEHIPLVGVGVDTPDLARTAAVRLASPVPNPFNPSTVLRMSLTTSSQVDWAIYDVRGRRVLTLAQGILPAGEHVRVWHGEDHQGARVASGVYFQRVSVPGTGSRTNKMVLLK